MTKRLVRLAVLLTCASGVMAGCGIPSQAQPTVVDPTAVPFGLAEPRQTAPSLANDIAEEPGLVYFVTDDRLVGVHRGLDTGTSREQVAAVLNALAGGPTQPEQDDGLSSAIPPELHLRLADTDAGRVTIDLSGDSGPSAGESKLTVAQIVLSVTSLAGVDQVQFTRDGQGEPSEVPLVDGSLTAAPLTAEHYLRLRDVADPDSRPGAEQQTEQGLDPGTDPQPSDSATPPSTPPPSTPPPSTRPEGPKSEDPKNEASRI